MNSTVEQRIKKHKAFWDREDIGRPLTSVTVADDFFFSRHYRAAQPLLKPKTVITADMLDVPAFMEDYERMYQHSLLVNQDAFWVAIPFTGIPWMEAMLGCQIVAMENSFVSEPSGATVDNQPDIVVSADNPWLLKYLEFTEALVKLSEGRFPVGQPIMRGPSDMLGSILGQEAMVYALMLQPERSRQLLQQVTEAFVSVIKRQEALLPDFHGGRSIGFYNIWAPGKCIWYQEDLSALLSPDLFRKMLRSCGEYICRDYDFNAIHLHPASFFIVDELLEMDSLRVIQVNKDIGGPSVPEMMDLLNRIAARKNLVLWGDLDEEDMVCIGERLATRGVGLHLVADVERANKLLEPFSGI